MASLPEKIIGNFRHHPSFCHLTSGWPCVVAARVLAGRSVTAFEAHSAAAEIWRNCGTTATSPAAPVPTGSRSTLPRASVQVPVAVDNGAGCFWLDVDVLALVKGCEQVMGCEVCEAWHDRCSSQLTCAEVSANRTSALVCSACEQSGSHSSSAAIGWISFTRKSPESISFNF